MFSAYLSVFKKNISVPTRYDDEDIGKPFFYFREAQTIKSDEGMFSAYIVTLTMVPLILCCWNCFNLFICS